MKITDYGFLPILGLVFITLKLIGVINWSWFWVLSPILFPFMLVGLFLLVGAIIAVLSAIFLEK